MSDIAGSTTVHPVSGHSLVARVKNILVQPRTEWQVIDTEPTTTRGLYTGYIILLAAIPAVAMFIGMAVFGIRIPLVGTYRVPIGSAITRTIFQYVLSLVAVYVLALIIDALAPTFAGQKSQIQALKVAAYASTAAWIGGIFNLVPSLGILGLLLSLYCLYLLYLGLPVLMKSPADKAVGYTAVVIVSAIIIFVVIGAITSRFIAYPTYPTYPT
jgi:hypothetical protein